MRVLVLGGTGAMGSHVCEKLAARGHDVVCTTRRARSASDGISYTVGDAHDKPFLDGLLDQEWDSVLDFMAWSTAEFRERCESLLGSTGQYVFTSSYRVYADSPVIREDSPRLLDVVDDAEYLATDEYALCKARCEDLLFGSGRSNWTVVRPAVTYDGVCGRLQLGVFESSDWLWRATNGIPVPMPREMLGKEATMSYGGNVAEMIARLVGNSEALGEAFTVSGSDHMTWGEVADAYARVLHFEVAECGLEDFERQRGGMYQIRYDRMFDRVVDNSKVLKATGMSNDSLTPMFTGLAKELRVYLDIGVRPGLSAGFQGKMDRLCGGMPSFAPIARNGMVALGKYVIRRTIRADSVATLGRRA